VADFLINYNMNFEANLQETSQWIVQLSHRYIKNHELALQNIVQMLQLIPGEIIKKQTFNINFAHEQIFSYAKNILRNHKEKLSFADQQMKLLHPKNILQKGYAIVRQDHKNISRVTKVNKGEPMILEFFDGEIVVVKKD
jgi:exonuclease VII large subunit